MMLSTVILVAVLAATASGEKWRCGESSTWQGAGQGAPHIIGGTEASAHAYPWLVSLERCSSSSCSHSCGAVLISRDYLITAAHCVSSGSLAQYVFVLGQHRRGEIPRVSPKRIRPISVKRHPRWSNDAGRGFPNDIAVVRLHKPAPIDGRTIVPARLPYGHPSDFTRSECWIAGWGRTESGLLGSAVRHARVNVLTTEDCKQRWGNQISDYHICVFDLASKSRGSCNGDSGGPLNCRSGSWVVAGLTSWGRRGCSTEYPSVYARVSYFRSWIRSQSGVYQEDFCEPPVEGEQPEPALY